MLEPGAVFGIRSPNHWWRVVDRDSPPVVFITPEIRGLSEHGEAGAASAESLTLESVLAGRSALRAAALPLDYLAFNALYHGVKVRAADVAMVEGAIARGRGRRSRHEGGTPTAGSSRQPLNRCEAYASGAAFLAALLRANSPAAQSRKTRTRGES